MSTKTPPNPIQWLKASGSPFEIGQVAGRQGREATHRLLLTSSIWAKTQRPEHAATLDRLRRNTKQQFPDIFEEISGLADGLALPFNAVFAWNCRGDLLASVPDGCTTVAEANAQRLQLAHNEDGLPFFRGHCFMLQASPSAQTGFTAFCYPASLAGHTFGWNESGLALAVNNLRLNGVYPEIPRMVLSRAVIGSDTLDQALAALSTQPQCGGFHLSLASATEARLLSIEYGAGAIAVCDIQQRSGHANHALHLTHCDQTLTQSSLDRQRRLNHLIHQPSLDALSILCDNTGLGLPIRRDDPNDPDQENTLATGIIQLSGEQIAWRVYHQQGGTPIFEGQQSLVAPAQRHTS